MSETGAENDVDETSEGEEEGEERKMRRRR